MAKKRNPITLGDKLIFSYYIFCKCPFFMGERHNFFGKFFLQKEELKNLKLSKILKFAEKTKRFEHET